MTPLLDKIERRTARIGVIGLGYVGLPLAVEFAHAGYEVTGFELSGEKVRLVNAGENYIQDVDDRLLAELVGSGTIKATTDFSGLRQMDCVSICVPTPLRKTKDPDLSCIISAVDQIKQHLHPHMLVVLESTTYPGTTDELIMPELTSRGYRIGEDMFLAFSPERVDPGNPVFKTKNTPKVIGGVTPACCRVATALYGTFNETVVPVSSTKAAEMVKLLENTFRAVNIGLVNEVAVMCDKLGLNVWEVIDAAATKPFGFMKFYPGPGLGGHCIPIDPHYLSWKLKALNYNARFIELAGDINSHMPDFVVQKLGNALNQHKKCFHGSRILVLGIAYKRDVNDVRESPALDVIQLLLQQRAEVFFHDPYIPVIQDHGLSMQSVELAEDVCDPGKFTEKALAPPSPRKISLRDMDAIVLVTNHACYDIKKLIDNIGQDILLFDCRSGLRGKANLFSL
jgi:UDP-N-acetyl-D-glucosamine dehydrogenase